MLDAPGVADVPTAVPLVRSWVAGRWRDAGSRQLHTNPARPDDVVAEVVLATPQLAREARGAARAAADGWRRTPAPARASVLRQAARLLRERTPELAQAVVREEGKTLPEAIGEAGRAAEIFEYFAGQAAHEPDGATFAPGAGPGLLYARRVPLGVVAAITPWNFPLAIPAWKLAPALGYGNVVIWKPAELVPVSSQMVLEILVDAGAPSGVVQMLIGDGPTIGAELVGVEDVDAITFTGSTPVGRALLRDAAVTGQRTQMELGGKNAAIVLADADLDRAVDLVARGAFLSAGQKCTATSRVIVERPVCDDFVTRLAERADAMVVGDPAQPGVDLGPLASDAGAQRVRAAVAQGEGEGRRVTRRAADDVPAGAFVAPVVLADLPSESALVTDEIFGPVVVVLAADDPDDALRIANRSPFGLTAGVHTRSLAQALRFADELRVGMVKINQETPGNAVHVPFGGTKGSAFGPGEQGKAAVEFFTEWKTTYLDAG